MIHENHEIKISVSVNKVLLEHIPAHSFIYCLWLLLGYQGRDESLLQRSYGQVSLKYLLYDPLQKVCQLLC